MFVKSLIKVLLYDKINVIISYEEEVPNMSTYNKHNRKYYLKKTWQQERDVALSRVYVTKELADAVYTTYSTFENWLAFRGIDL